VTGGAHDTLRDELAEALWRLWADADNEHDADWSIVPDDEKHTWRGYAEVALRYADTQVAAERERLAADLRICGLLAEAAGNSARAAAFETAAEIVETEPAPAGGQP
jgi:hypothetical protein